MRLRDTHFHWQIKAEKLNNLFWNLGVGYEW